MEPLPHKYDFRNRILTESPRLSPTDFKRKAALALTENMEIVIPRTRSRLVRYFSDDLCHFLSDALGLSLRLRVSDDIRGELAAPAGKLLFVEEAHLASPSPLTSSMAGAFHITVTEEYALVVGKTERGTAQGAYYIEDILSLVGEGQLPCEACEHAPLFSPRMTHSGTELDTFPDELLAAIAHAGMDAIIVYAGHPDSHLHGFPDPEALWPGTGRGYCDFANLVWRAAGYGLDVYVYSQLICDKHPSEPDARAYYDASFGRIFREAPGLRGLILVGESFEFPSRDPNTCGIRSQKRPEGEKRPSPGRYPSCDYPEMLSLVRDVVRTYSEDADIVFWSYNFGWTPKEARLSLIERLPRDISYLVTFEVWERLTDEAGRRYSVADYSIAYPGPCTVFREEAEKAHACGLRLYTMGNTGGRTWDTGGTPYIPTPGLWHKRYAAIRAAGEEYGLCGLMENHHYGWLPSFLTLYAKHAFLTNTRTDEETLRAIARRDFGKEADTVLAAWRRLDAGMARVIPSVIDQYGPFRAGATYPLLFTQTAAELTIPRAPFAWHPAGGIWKPVYPDEVFGDVDASLMRLTHTEDAVAAFREGLSLMEEAVTRCGAPTGSEPARQLAVVRFLTATYVSAMHVMRWNIAKRLLLARDEGRDIPRKEELTAALGLPSDSREAIAAELFRLADAERENVALALLAYREDSSIGYEASMEYVFDEENAAWKLAELERTLTLLRDYLKRSE